MTSTGSTTLDEGPFRLDVEASLNVYGHAFAEPMTNVFETDLKPTADYTCTMWKKLPLTEKLVEKFVLPIRSPL